VFTLVKCLVDIRGTNLCPVEDGAEAPRCPSVDPPRHIHAEESRTALRPSSLSSMPAHFLHAMGVLGVGGRARTLNQRVELSKNERTNPWLNAGVGYRGEATKRLARCLRASSFSVGPNVEGVAFRVLAGNIVTAWRR
jgi:hypothetical protein